MFPLDTTQTLSPEEYEELMGDSSGTNTSDLGPGTLDGSGNMTFGGTDGSDGFNLVDWFMDNPFSVFLVPVVFLLLIALVVVIVVLVRKRRRASRTSNDTAEAQRQVANLGLDPSTLTVTLSGYALATDSGARRIAVLHPRRPEVAAQLLTPDQVLSVGLDEASHVVTRRNGTSSHMDMDGDFHSGSSNISTTTFVDRVILAVRTPDVRRPLVQIPFIDADAGSVTQGSRIHSEQLAAAREWQARFEAFAAQVR